MKNVRALPLALSLIAAFEVRAAAKLVIYGDDDRLEVSSATEFQQKLARGAATMIHQDRMSTDPQRPGLIQLDQTTLKITVEGTDDEVSALLTSKRSLKVSEALKSGIKFCPDEKFVNQPNPGMCSGFLIASDLIVTAGHCVDLPNFCEEFKWVFDFTVNPVNKAAGVDMDPDNIYSCKKVMSSGLIMPLGLDYAVVQLDRKVKNREPLEIRNDDKIKDDAPLVIIGSPSGLPLKVAAGANVRGNTHPFYFTANLDSFQGNSGSAVFDAITGKVEGILVRGETDFEINIHQMCLESKKCENDKCRGEDVTRLTAIPEIGIQKVLYDSVLNNDLKTLENLFKLTFWVDIYGKDGQSALMKAAAVGNNKVIEFLISKKADVNLADINGDTALHLAARNNGMKGIRILLEAGANKNAVNLQGDTILHILARAGKKGLIKKLIKLGADPAIKNKQGLTAKELRKKNLAQVDNI